ncbi:MAG: class I SAM-dependent methyltransferase [Cyanobacteriota bacterium]
MERIREPELMEDPLQVKAYAEADFTSTDQAFTLRILELLASPPPGRALPAACGGPGILDLGCGPGNISFRLAAALPQASVVGLDGAAAMLARAECQRQQEPGRWHHLRFQLARLSHSPQDLAPLDALPAPFRPPYGVIVSNSLLHHLHDPAVLWQTVRHLAAPRALVVVRDLRRPPNPEALHSLMERHAATAPPVLRRDYAHSLAAAFRPEEVEAQLEAAGLSSLRVASLDDRYLEVSGRLPA